MTSRRSGTTRLFLIAGLLVGLALALLVSPFASTAPDGLETVAEEEGFAGAADDHRLAGSPLADYGVEGVEDEQLSTAASGAVGVLLTFGIGIGVFAGIRALRPADDRHAEPGASTAGAPSRM